MLCPARLPLEQFVCLCGTLAWTVGERGDDIRIGECGTGRRGHLAPASERAPDHPTAGSVGWHVRRLLVRRHDHPSDVCPVRFASVVTRIAPGFVHLVRRFCQTPYSFYIAVRALDRETK